MELFIILLQILFILASGLFSAYVFWSIISGRVFVKPPAIPSDSTARGILFELIEKHIPDVKEKSYRFIDLGCGYGTLTFHAAKKYPQCHSAGVDFSMIAFLFSKARRALFNYENVEIIHSDYFNIDLQDYDVVFCYLHNLANERVKQKLIKDLKPGSFVLSNSFPFQNWKPIEVRSYSDIVVTRKVYIYQVTEEMKANGEDKETAKTSKKTKRKPRSKK